MNFSNGITFRDRLFYTEKCDRQAMFFLDIAFRRLLSYTKYDKTKAFRI
jgi:hypothetical protein